MNIRRFNKTEDYFTYESMYLDWDLPVCNKSWIPEDTFAVEFIDQIVCVGSLYQLSNTPMFWIEGIVTNKSFEKEIRKEALDLLVDKLFKEAKQKGAEVIMSSTPRNGLKDIFHGNGFNETPEKYFHLARFE